MIDKPITISIRAKPEDFDKMNKIRKMIQAQGKRSFNSDVLRKSLSYTVNNRRDFIKWLNEVDGD